jgi:hypothetical protein
MAECAMTLVDLQRILRGTMAFWFDQMMPALNSGLGRMPILSSRSHTMEAKRPDFFTRKLSS